MNGYFRLLPDASIKLFTDQFFLVTCDGMDLNARQSYEVAVATPDDRTSPVKLKLPISAFIPPEPRPSAQILTSLTDPRRNVALELFAERNPAQAFGVTIANPAALAAFGDGSPGLIRADPTLDTPTPLALPSYVAATSTAAAKSLIDRVYVRTVYRGFGFTEQGPIETGSVICYGPSTPPASTAELSVLRYSDKWYLSTPPLSTPDSTIDTAAGATCTGP